MKRVRRFLLIVISFIIVVFLVWGFIGGQQAQDAGITCDFGLGNAFCWKWHTNALGQVQEFIEDAGNTVKDFAGD